MKHSIVLSTDQTFLKAAADALRTPEDPDPKLMSSIFQAEQYLAGNETQLLLIDGHHAPPGAERFLCRAVSLYPNTWFITTGEEPPLGVIRVESPVMAKQLTLFQKNDPMPRPEQNDENWTQNYIENILPILLDHLWNGLLNSWVLSDRTVILMAGRHAQIPYLENMRILPVLVKTTHVSKVEESVTMASRTHLFFADLLSRHLLIHPLGGTVLDRFSQKWAVLAYLDVYPCTPEEMARRCAAAAEEAGHHDWQLNFCIGEPVEPAGLLDQWNKLEALSEGEIGYHPSIRYAGQQFHRQVAPMPETKALTMLLEQGLCQEADQWVRNCIFPLAQQDLLDTQWLLLFRDELLQSVYSALQCHGIPAEQILTQQLLSSEFQRVAGGVQLLTNWFHQILERIDLFLQEEKPDTPVKKAQKFILQHLDQELSREDIAAQVYISSSYLGRLFKQELNMNLSEYVFQERMKLAAQMLEQTSLSVTEIALRVGFSNFPYFSTQFKKYSGLTPVEYRRKNRMEP